MVAAVLFQTDAQNPDGQAISEEGTFGRELVDPHGDWYEKARIISTDPTIVLASSILAAPLLTNEWSVSGRDQAAVELIKLTLIPHRKRLMRNAVMSGMKYGWQSWEVRPWRIPGESGTVHFRTKPLRHEFTTILSTKDGFPRGVLNQGFSLTEPIEGGRTGSILTKQVNLPYAAFIAASEEYDDPLGYPLLKNCLPIYNRYQEVEAGANRYVNRVAGSHWVLWYPEGTTATINGQEVPSDVLAGRIIDALQSSGRIALPVSDAELQTMLSGSKSGGEAKKSGWDIKLITSEGGIDPFLERQRYLDALKMRALLVPERTALEGQFGTKAESSEHADIALMGISAWGESIIEWMNSPYGFVAALLKFNGIEYYPGRVRIDPRPLADQDRAFFREVFRTIINNAEQWCRIVDVDLIGERIGVPLDKEMIEKLKKLPIQETGPTGNPNSNGGGVNNGGSSSGSTTGSQG